MKQGITPTKTTYDPNAKAKVKSDVAVAANAAKPAVVAPVSVKPAKAVKAPGKPPKVTAVKATSETSDSTPAEPSEKPVATVVLPATATIVAPAMDDKALVPYVLNVCQHIYNNLNAAQKIKWDRGSGKEAPNYRSGPHKMAAVLINFFDLGVSKEESLSLHVAK